MHLLKPTGRVAFRLRALSSFASARGDGILAGVLQPLSSENGAYDSHGQILALAFR